MRSALVLLGRTTQIFVRFLHDVIDDSARVRIDDLKFFLDPESETEIAFHRLAAPIAKKRAVIPSAVRDLACERSITQISNRITG